MQSRPQSEPRRRHANAAINTHTHARPLRFNPQSHHHVPTERIMRACFSFTLFVTMPVCHRVWRDFFLTLLLIVRSARFDHIGTAPFCSSPSQRCHWHRPLLLLTLTTLPLAPPPSAPHPHNAAPRPRRKVTIAETSYGEIYTSTLVGAAQRFSENVRTDPGELTKASVPL
jgi:hypothetical protein